MKVLQAIIKAIGNALSYREKPQIGYIDENGKVVW